MNKEEYIIAHKAAVGEISARMQELDIARTNLKKLKHQYIQDNRLYPDYAYVELVLESGVTHKCYIRSAEISFHNDIEYTFYQCKKDGSVSSRQLNIGWSQKVKYIKVLS